MEEFLIIHNLKLKIWRIYILNSQHIWPTAEDLMMQRWKVHWHVHILNCVNMVDQNQELSLLLDALIEIIWSFITCPISQFWPMHILVTICGHIILIVEIYMHLLFHGPQCLLPKLRRMLPLIGVTKILEESSFQTLNKPFRSP